MGKILGLDLGTNSIGWAIRETDINDREFYLKAYKGENSQNINIDNEIIDFGVVVFKKGVGEGKSGEYSLAAERRANRSKRRLYNAKRYRKWELLKVLIENNMCPLTEAELRLWSIGNWQEVDGKKKNLGRIYPIGNEDFQKWLAFDPVYFESKGISEKGNMIRKNPYDLRFELLKEEETNEFTKRQKVGRAFYHLVQRRGFRSSRKSGKSTFAENAELEKRKLENPDFHIATLAIEKLDNGERFRNSGVIQRKYFEDEFGAICKKQNLNDELTNRLHSAIYFIRPLRSQKGLVGNCTLEKGKPRIPISHPKFEEFRGLQFINNIKWREKGNQTFESIPITLKKRILEELFFRKIEKGANKGKVTTENYFKFDDIIEKYSENGKYEFNFRNKPNVSICPTIASLMNIFNVEWTNKFIQDENRYGVNWEGLKIEYLLKYGKIKRKIKDGKKIYIPKNIGDQKTLRVDEIWHLLFDYIQTKDNQEGLEKFCKEVLELDNEKAKAFSEINIPQGYGSLSFSAIVKILPFLQEGFIYSEAVSFANLKKVLGNKFENGREQAKAIIAKSIHATDEVKERLNIVNGMIQEFFAENHTSRAKGVDNILKEMAAQDTIDKLKKYFGAADWNQKSEKEKAKYEEDILNLYLKFLNGEQSKEEKASSRMGKNPDIDYYQLPRLDEANKQNLKTAFDLPDAALKHLYHPSDIEMYPKSKSETKVRINGIEQFVKQLESPQPPSKGWKNPMAMRTLHELRHLLNYLFRVGKIDHETKIVVEMARELNTTNYRKAYTDWIKDRDNENRSYKASILELYKITDPSFDDYNKFRAAVEQIVEYELIENKTSHFQQKYNEFVDTYLKTIRISERSKDELLSDEYYDYLMYLIINRDEFRKMLNFKLPNSNKWHTQLIATSSNFDKKRKELTELLTKYRLWEQQKFQCFYTGQMIPFGALFSESYQIEHTIPRSISFDNELKNLTICDSVYNSSEKNNRFPSQCRNYDETKVCRTVKGQIPCTPIIDRIKTYIFPKVKELHTRIKNLETINKGLNDEEKKNANIRLRHYLKFELEYWEKKYLTFTIKKDDWKDGWKNSQLVDTQIISKYARAYIKTVFEKVDVQKGSVVNDFKKIYGIKGDEKKDRTTHSHHAVDAAVLTLIPGSAKREEILKKYYKALENNTDKLHYPISPLGNDNFDIQHILFIQENLIINHHSKDQTLNQASKKVRKHGKVQKFQNLNGPSQERYMRGDTIRGQLHLESYFGAIKPNELNENGYPLKENGKFLTRKINGANEEWIVMRKPIENISFEKDEIVDKVLKQYLLNQLRNGTPKENLVDFNNKVIRHLRCRVKAGLGYFSKEKAIPIKRHIFKSRQTHKQSYLVQNSDNYLFLLYEGKNDKGKNIRNYKILNRIDLESYNIKNINEIKFNELLNFYEKKVGNKILKIPLKAIIKPGDNLILYKEHRDELTKENLNSRLFIVYKFNEPSTAFVFLQHHMEARSNEILTKLEESEFDPGKYQPRLFLSINKLNCLIEGADFQIKQDGEIELL